MSLFRVRAPRWQGEAPLYLPSLSTLLSLLLPYGSSDWKGQAFPPLLQPALQPYCRVERTIFSTVPRKSVILNLQTGNDSCSGCSRTIWNRRQPRINRVVQHSPNIILIICSRVVMLYMTAANAEDLVVFLNNEQDNFCSLFSEQIINPAQSGWFFLFSFKVISFTSIVSTP